MNPILQELLDQIDYSRPIYYGSESIRFDLINGDEILIEILGTVGYCSIRRDTLIDWYYHHKPIGNFNIEANKSFFEQLKLLAI